MSRSGPRTPTIEARILAALRIERRRGGGPLTVAELHNRPGLTGRRSPEIAEACERLVDRGDVVPGWRRVRFVGACWTYRLTGELEPSCPPERTPISIARE